MSSQSKIVAPGSSIAGWLPGFRILGLTVDNPTGSWINVISNNGKYNWYIPPYTTQFSKSLDPSVISLQLISGDGPAGKLGTTAGTSWTATVYSFTVGDSDGFPIVLGDKPPIKWFNTVPVADGTIFTVVTPPSGQALRIFGLISSWRSFNTSEQDSVIRINWWRKTITGSNQAVVDALLTPQHPTIPMQFPGLDLLVDETIRTQASMIYGPTGANRPTVSLTVIYSII